MRLHISSTINQLKLSLEQKNKQSLGKRVSKYFKPEKKLISFLNSLSSRKLEMRPFNKAVKKVSGIQVSVCRDVENLKEKVFYLKKFTNHVYYKNKGYRCPPTFKFIRSPEIPFPGKYILHSQ